MPPSCKGGYKFEFRILNCGGRAFKCGYVPKYRKAIRKMMASMSVQEVHQSLTDGLRLIERNRIAVLEDEDKLGCIFFKVKQKQ